MSELPPASDVTRLLSQIGGGDGQATEQLLPLEYDELRKPAAAKLAQEKPGQTLQATALVHEAYIRLVDVEKAQHWNSRGTSSAPQRRPCGGYLVSNARRKKSQKHGGDLQQAELDLLDLAGLASDQQRDKLIALDEALALGWLRSTLRRVNW